MPGSPRPSIHVGHLCWTFSFGVDDVPASSVDYSGIEYPQMLPLPSSAPVALSLQETTLFSVSLNDTKGDSEWSSILFYSGAGRVTFGEEQRAFIPSSFHQFHCLRGLQRSIVFPGDRADVNSLKLPDEHVKHCLNYIRQTLLCNPTYTLERGDFMEGSFEPGSLGSDLVCLDWEVVFSEMDRRYTEFMKWNEEWN